MCVSSRMMAGHPWTVISGMSGEELTNSGKGELLIKKTLYCIFSLAIIRIHGGKIENVDEQQ